MDKALYNSKNIKKRMKKRVIYPTVEKIIEYNTLILNILQVKKADQPKVLSIEKIKESIEECKKEKGDIYDKATILMCKLIRNHPFASGNRRTAFIITKRFLRLNKAKFKIGDSPEYARIMLGIREGYYSKKEIKEWIKNGKIRKFER